MLKSAEAVIDTNICQSKEDSCALSRPLQPSLWCGPLAAGHGQLLRLLVEQCLPPVRSATQEVPLAWLRSVAAIQQRDVPLTLAMSALGFGWSASIGDDCVPMGHGMECYSAATKELRLCVLTAPPLTTMCTMTLMATYELYEFGREKDDGLAVHLSGMASTLRRLGRTRAAEKPLFDIFLFYRTIEVRFPARVI